MTAYSVGCAPLTGNAGPRRPPNPVRRFDWSQAECFERFSARMESVRGDIRLVGDDWPATLFGLLKAKGAGSLHYGPGAPCSGKLLEHWPDGGEVALVPYAEPVEGRRDTLFNELDAAFCAIAETGSLLLRPTREEPRLMSLVPPLHCVLVDAADIQTSLHEVLVEEDWAGRGMPTNLLLISGPSKSADIEQTLAYGVHGPKELLAGSGIGLKAGRPALRLVRTQLPVCAPTPCRRVVRCGLSPKPGPAARDRPGDLAAQVPS